MSVDESKNFVLNEQVASVKVNKRMSYNDMIDIDILDCRINCKVQEIINEIENEIIQ